LARAIRSDDHSVRRPFDLFDGRRIALEAELAVDGDERDRQDESADRRPEPPGTSSDQRQPFGVDELHVRSLQLGADMATITGSADPDTCRLSGRCYGRFVIPPETQGRDRRSRPTGKEIGP
jgi:hypothetical protein